MEKFTTKVVRISLTEVKAILADYLRTYNPKLKLPEGAQFNLVNRDWVEFTWNIAED